jgi:hypothetical protein
MAASLGVAGAMLGAQHDSTTPRLTHQAASRGSLSGMPTARGTRPQACRNPPKRWSVTTVMTKLRPLSDKQLALVQQGANGLPPEWRDDFVHAVAEELLPLDNITDTDVNGAVAVVLLRIMMAA